MSDLFEKQMKRIAEDAGNLTHDGGDDTRLFLDDSHIITIHAPTMGEEEYQEMEKEINDFSIVREKYSVYVWNDCSGWDYWNKEGKTGDTNYIQITVNIDDISINNEEISQLNRDVNEAFDKFCCYDNTECVEWGKYLG